MQNLSQKLPTPPLQILSSSIPPPSRTVMMSDLVMSVVFVSREKILLSNYLFSSKYIKTFGILRGLSRLTLLWGLMLVWLQRNDWTSELIRVVWFGVYLFDDRRYFILPLLPTRHIRRAFFHLRCGCCAQWWRTPAAVRTYRILHLTGWGNGVQSSFWVCSNNPVPTLKSFSYVHATVPGSVSNLDTWVKVCSPVVRLWAIHRSWC